jgi:hypothetical protein
MGKLICAEGAGPVSSVSAYGVVVSSTLLESRPRNLQVDYVADLSSGRYFGPYALCTSSRRHLSLLEVNRNINKRSSLFHQRRVSCYAKPVQETHQ